MNLAEGNAIADSLVRYAEEYGKARTKSARAKVDFEILLTARMPELMEKKKNAGFDTLCLMLISIDESAKELYDDWKYSEARYKSLERLIDANQTKISFLQSALKHEQMMGG